ncbi:hypothetical protein [Spirosoma validum]|uniref:Lipoprotein n=1 Tax=Spirosoma validum TaxID=2771355 RepID=A0A927AXI7_9BACT|nr:hypothetical protein [Spirosoma validum]MBD2751588.1 hypothetical protein [Spirosoma validum]
MRKYPLALPLYLMSVLLMVGCNRLGSLTTIQPGKQFELGGSQKGAFTARLQNVGEVQVMIFERLIDGKRVSLGALKPGAEQTLRFSSGSAALFDNVAAKSAQLHLVVTGDKNLSMRERSN